LNDAREELDRLKIERRTLDEQIAAAEGAKALQSVDPIATADAIVAKLRAMAANVHEMPKFAVRQLLASVVGRVVVDMVTKAVEVQIMLPIGENFFGDLPAAKSMRLVGNSGASTSYETHPMMTISLGSIDCQFHKAANPICYNCRRSAA